MKDNKKILDQYFESAKQEEINISVNDISSLINTNVSPITNIITLSKTMLFVKYTLISISSMLIISALVYLFTSGFNTSIFNKDYDSELIIEPLKESPSNNIIIEEGLTFPIKEIIEPKKRHEENSYVYSVKEQVLSDNKKTELINDIEPETNTKDIVKENYIIQDKSIKNKIAKKENSTAKCLEQTYYISKIFNGSKARVHLLNSNNKRLYNSISPLCYNKEKWALAQKKKKFGFLDCDGIEVVDLEYDKIYHYKEVNGTWAKMIKKNLFGFLDTNGHEVVKAKYNKISIFNEYHKNWAMVRIGKKYGFINKYGDEIVDVKYDKISHFGVINTNWALVRLEKKYGFIDDTGKEIIPLIYSRIFHFGNIHKGWAMVQQGNLFGFIDKETNVIVAPKYNKIFFFGEHQKDWLKVKEGLFYGFIDKTGKEIISPKYTNISYFGEYKEDWALVKINKLYGFIDKNGKEVVPVIYLTISYFNVEKEGKMKVTRKGETVYLDKQGNEIKL